MKVIYGDSRTVICLGGYAFKFPRFGVIWGFIISQFLDEERRDSQISSINYVITVLLKGFIANFTEYAVSNHLHSKALAPVYVSLGFMSIQKLVVGNHPHYTDLAKCFNRLSPDAWQAVQEVNLHNWDERNFVKVATGQIYMIDYGDVLLSGSLSLSNWLECFHYQFSKVLLNLD
jgi:hypothetical protein